MPRIALLLFATVVYLLMCLTEAQAASWVPLDALGDRSSAKKLLREGDQSSVKRSGPWVTFNQRWRTSSTKFVPLFEAMAVNCLTGAFSAKSYEHDDPKTQQRVIFEKTFEEIEKSQHGANGLSLVRPQEKFKKTLTNFACQCRRPLIADQPPEAEILRLYAKLIERQTSRVEWQLRFIELDSEEKALQLIEDLAKGASFASLADLHSLNQTFKGGLLGFNSENSWTPRWTRIFRTLALGEYTKHPVPDYGKYLLYLLEDERTAPALSVEDWRVEIEAYYRTYKSCGWELE